MASKTVPLWARNNPVARKYPSKITSQPLWMRSNVQVMSEQRPLDTVSAALTDYRPGPQSKLGPHESQAEADSTDDTEEDFLVKPVQHECPKCAELARELGSRIEEIEAYEAQLEAIRVQLLRAEERVEAALKTAPTGE